MSSPRLEIDLGRIEHNAAALVERLGERGIGITGVTKATLGSPEVARSMLRAGATGIGEARIECIETLRAAGVACTTTLLRSPMTSQVARVVAAADVSCNTEPAVIGLLADAAQAQGRTHGVLLMVELGDLREGILPVDLDAVVDHVLGLGGVRLHGIGTNLACQSGVIPDARTMAVLSGLAEAVERRFGVHLAAVSGGSSANLDWALGAGDVGRIDDLRIGEAILLGCEPLRRSPIVGLRTDACAVVAEVIESKRKPSAPWGSIAQGAFGVVPARPDRGLRHRAILALGRQDVDPDGLVAPAGTEIVGASSDHLVLDTGDVLVPVGAEISFRPDYGALLRAATSPFVERSYRGV